MSANIAEKKLIINRAVLEKICSSQRWQTLVLKLIKEQFPEGQYSGTLKGHSPQLDQNITGQALKELADKAFCQLLEEDWLEAFSGHPMIGDISSLKEKYAHGKNLSEKEQSQVSQASDTVLHTLLELNHHYLDKYGFIFIVCATNKSALQMLEILQSRIKNSRADELLNASIEQRKISHIRMEGII